SPVIVPWFAKSLVAETTCETGLMFTNARSPLGSVSTGTNAFDRNVSGNMTIIEIPCTLCADRATVPTYVNAQERDQPVMTTSASAPATPTTPPPGRHHITMPVRKVRLPAIAKC